MAGANAVGGLGGVNVPGDPRGGGRWPKDRSVWEARPDHGPRTDGRHVTGFWERPPPPVGKPPPEMVGLLQRELMLQQKEFQREMMLQIEEMLTRVHGGGPWLNPTRFS